MLKKTFTNKMYINAIDRIKENRDFVIKEATEKADMNAIVDMSRLIFTDALMNEESYSALAIYFAHLTENIVPIKVFHGDYDYTMQGTIVLYTYIDAADFLAACTLFIKYSSDYQLIVDNGKYTFHFNMDRISEDVYDQELQ